MNSNSLEQRVSNLERELLLLKQKSVSTTENWYEDVSGSLQSIPDDVYQEFQRECREFRQAQDHDVKDA